MTGEVISVITWDRYPVPDSWDYRCATPAHPGPCLVPVGPVTARQALKHAAWHALHRVGVVTPPGEWTDADLDIALDLSRVLTDLAVASTTIREKRARGASLRVLP